MRCDAPNNGKDKRWIDMDEQGGNLVPVVKDKTIPPGDDSTSQRAQRQAVTRDEECGTRRHSPYEDEIEDVGVVAEVEEEVVPCAFLVHVHPERKVIGCLNRIDNMYPPDTEAI